MVLRTRRYFLRGSLALSGLGLTVGCGITTPWARFVPPSVKVPRIACLTLGGPSSNFDAPFRRGLADLGYVEGRTIAIEWRADEGREERLKENAARLLDLNLDLVVAAGESRVQVIRAVSTTLPIVMSAGVDPVATGLIESFGRPGAT
jgi:putative tryptophan/tyrosine transport system substrate-binding protein